MNKLLLSLLVICGLVACDPAAGDPASPAASDGHSHGAGDAAHDHGSGAMQLLDDGLWAHHGHGVHDGETYPVEDVFADLAKFDGQTLRIGGPVESVCQASGSWLRLGSADANVLVRFKDYGFFVPKDAAGEAVIEGELNVVESAEAAGSEVTFTATGVAFAKDD